MGIANFKGLSFGVGDEEVRFAPLLNSLVSFLLIAISVYFFVVKPVQKLMTLYKTGRKEESTTRDCPHCLSAIPKRATRCPFCTSAVASES